MLTTTSGPRISVRHLMQYLVSENDGTRRFECGRLRGFEASGCILSWLDPREGVQARYQACCESRLRRPIHAG
jgi:hypothetical protein